MKIGCVLATRGRPKRAAAVIEVAKALCLLRGLSKKEKGYLDRKDRPNPDPIAAFYELLKLGALRAAMKAHPAFREAADG